ncbi:MAG TPA: hypothetical protein VF103_13990, partial [Polyangiaceae bacterium]
VTPVNNKDKNSFDEYRDQLFWQTTAAEVLGRIGDPQAVEPLFRVLLDPTKGDCSVTALLALVKLGKPSADAAAKLLKSDYEKLQAYQSRRIKEASGNEAKGAPWVTAAALVLGTGGRPEAGPALIAALESEKDEATHTLLTSELAKVPATPESIEAFKKAFKAVPLGSLPELSEAIGRFLDPELVPWMLETAGSLKGADNDKEAAQAALVETALKIAKPSQIADVKAAAVKFEADRAKSLLTQVEPLLAACKEDANCYLDAIQKGDNQSEANQFIGIKAGYMIGIVGNEGTRDKLIDGLSKISNAALRYVSAQAIDHLTPKGSKTVAEKLRKIIDENAKSPDKDKSSGDNTLKQVMYRLDARAG